MVVSALILSLVLLPQTGQRIQFISMFINTPYNNICFSFVNPLFLTFPFSKNYRFLHAVSLLTDTILFVPLDIR